MHWSHVFMEHEFGQFGIMTWWRHQMETFSALLAICAGNSPVPGEFPTQRPVTWSSGGRLNKKDGLTRYGDSHVKDKTS